jgi:hypothetical protein
MLLLELFDFNLIYRRLAYLIKFLTDNEASFHKGLPALFDKMKTLLKLEILDVSDKFKSQVTQLIQQHNDIEGNEPLQDRVKKACTYFLDKTKIILGNPFQSIEIDSDNKTLRKSALDILKNLREDTNVKIACLTQGLSGFASKKYLEVKAKSGIELPETKVISTTVEDLSISQLSHPQLYKILRNWRDNKADEQNVHFNIILPQKIMIQIVTQLPRTTSALKAIKGFGKKKTTLFGKEILAIISAYLKEKNIEKPKQNIENEDDELPVKKESKQISFELFKSGQTIEEIAKTRDMAASTIEGHLAQFVGTGEIELSQLVDNEKASKIIDYFSKTKNFQLGPAKTKFGDDVSYSELRYVLKYLQYKGEMGEQI